MLNGVRLQEDLWQRLEHSHITLFGSNTVDDRENSCYRRSLKVMLVKCEKVLTWVKWDWASGEEQNRETQLPPHRGCCGKSWMGTNIFFFTNLFPLSTTEYMLMLNTEMWLLTPVLLEMDNSGWRSLWMQADTHLLHSPQGWNREIRGIRFSFKLSLLSSRVWCKLIQFTRKKSNLYNSWLFLFACKAS